MQQQPTIGRIVHAYGAAFQASDDSIQLPPPEAAMIVGLHEEELVVDLTVFQSNGIFQQHRVKFSPEPMPYHWTWPPRV